VAQVNATSSSINFAANLIALSVSFDVPLNRLFEILASPAITSLPRSAVPSDHLLTSSPISFNSVSAIISHPRLLVDPRRSELVNIRCASEVISQTKLDNQILNVFLV
jgi:hypothetical protein